MCIPQTVEFLQINNMNIEFTNVFSKSHRMQHLKRLEMMNNTNSKKNLDENEIAAINNFCPNLEQLILRKSHTNDKTLSLLIQKFQDLSKSVLFFCLLQLIYFDQPFRDIAHLRLATVNE